VVKSNCHYFNYSFKRINYYRYPHQFAHYFHLAYYYRIAYYVEYRSIPHGITRAAAQTNCNAKTGGQPQPEAHERRA
ncbi:MAG: hypothetical protein ACP5I8_12650, partial [Phycisphaerae bacterium]